MSHFRTHRPTPEEYAEFYAGYVGLVPEGDILEILRRQLTAGLELYAAIPEAKLDYRYAPGKWTTREVVGHVVDTERVFSYRALTIARGDTTPLPGMDQEEFMAGADFGRRPMAGLVEEYRHLRAANLALFESFDAAILSRAGTASGFPVTVRAILYILAGHELHHLGILAERYGVK